MASIYRFGCVKRQFYLTRLEKNFSNMVGPLWALDPFWAAGPEFAGQYSSQLEYVLRAH